jgi:GNAT superfamily N-acetyltransferase
MPDRQHPSAAADPLYRSPRRGPGGPGHRRHAACIPAAELLLAAPGSLRRARALLNAVREAATAAGATRISVQTEPGNTAALQLYRTSGFFPVDGIQVLMLPLQHSETSSPANARCAA